MAFPTSNLRLSTVLSTYGYGTTGSMSSLRGKNYSDVTAPYTQRTIPLTGNFALSSLFGETTSLRLADRSGEAGPASNPSQYPGTMDCIFGFTDASYTFINGNVTSLTLTAYYNNKSTVSAILGPFTMSFTINGIAPPFSPTTVNTSNLLNNSTVYTFPINTSASLSITLSFIITEKISGQNNQANGNFTALYNVTPGGLVPA